MASNTPHQEEQETLPDIDISEGEEQVLSDVDTDQDSETEGMEQVYINTVKEALTDGRLGRLTLIIGAGVTLSAISCGKTSKSKKEREEKIDALGWKGLLLGGLKYLKKGGFVKKATKSEQKEHKFYQSILESTTIEPSVSTLLRIASFLKGQLVDRQRLPRWLKDEFGNLYDDYIGKGQPNEMLDAIRDLYLAKARIITTNYDDLLHKHLSADTVLTDKPDSIVNFWNKSDPRRPILHIHGIWNEPQGAVLDGVDYFKVNQDFSTVDSLRACLRSAEVVLFVGTGSGLDDPTFGRLLTWADQTLSGGTEQQYILGLNGYESKSDYLNVIHYGKKHEELPSFLRSLIPVGPENDMNYVPFDLTGAPVVKPFCGRKKELVNIQKHLQPISDAIQQKVLVIHGLGGIGKTQLALEYAKICRNEYTAIFWLRGRTQQSLDLDLANIARRVPIRNVLDPDGELTQSNDAIEKAKKAVFEWLRRKGNFRWLMIIDNVGNREIGLSSQEQGENDVEATEKATFDIRPYFEPLAQGSIIITTRPRYMAQLGTAMELLKMPLPESIELLRKTCQKDAADTEYQDIAARLDGLPLALNTAGCYIYSQGITWKKYLDRYNSDSKKLLEHRPELSRYDASIMTTWEGSLAAAEQTRPMITKLLGICACFDQSDLSFGLFNFTSANLSDWLRDLFTDEEAVDKTVGILRSLAFFQENEGTGSYSMHPVVCEWLRQRLGRSEWIYILATAARVVGNSRSVEGVDQYWKRNKRLMPHVEACVSLLQKSEDQLPMVAAVYTEIAIIAYDQGRMRMADWLYGQAASQPIRNSLDDWTEEVTRMGNTALLKNAQGQYAEAEVLYLQVQAIYDSLIVDDASLASALTLKMNNMLNMGENYLCGGRISEARYYYGKVLEIDQGTLRIEGGHVYASAMNGLGNVYAAEHNYTEAERCYLIALADRERAHGPSHIRTLNILQNLSLVYEFQGKLDDAEAAHTRCLNGFDRELGPGHLKSIRAAGNMGRFLHIHRPRRLSTARPLYERAVQGLIRELGENIAETQGVMRNYDIYNRAWAKVQARMEADGLSEVEAVDRIIAENVARSNNQDRE